jgi:hypothetical protein
MENQMNSKQFDKIVNEAVLLQGRPLETRTCPDQYLGLISEMTAQHEFAQRIPASQRPAHPCVLMVLESPHKDEFVGDLGPAKGATGEMIREHLLTSLDLPSVENYGLILINAIQHQCSLGSDTIVYRDRIFRAVWTNGGEADFCNRMISVFRSSDILVNCCTKGNDSELYRPLRRLVEIALQESFPNVASLRRTHPSSW